MVGSDFDGGKRDEVQTLSRGMAQKASEGIGASMRFNAARYLRHLLQFTDAELIKAGKACSRAASRNANAIVQERNALKYVALKQEWRRRHPKPKITSE
jgi:hypothetical protein